MTSVTRLSICPWMITTSLGRSVPRWIATMSRTRVGVGMREPVTVSDGSTMVRQLPQAAESRWNSPRSSSSAAPIPRFGSVCDESVCRVPKLTRVSIVCRSCAWLTGATIARRRASGEGGGAAPISSQAARATQFTHHDSPSFVAASAPRAVECEWHCRPSAAGLRQTPILREGYSCVNPSAPLLAAILSRRLRRQAATTAIPPILTGAPSAAAINAALRLVRRAEHGDAHRARTLEGQADRRDDARRLRPAQRADRRRQRRGRLLPPGLADGRQPRSRREVRSPDGERAHQAVAVAADLRASEGDPDAGATRRPSST